MLSAAVRAAFPQSRSTGLLGGRSVAQAVFGKQMSLIAQAAKPVNYHPKWATFAPGSVRSIHSSAKVLELKDRKEDGKSDDVPVGFENFLNKSPKKDGGNDKTAAPSSKPETTTENKPSEDENGNKSEESSKGPEPDTKGSGSKSSGGGEKKGSKKDEGGSTNPSASDVL
ncbi:hypothetical protein IWW38_005582, partial [Coemansia aciculifera]